MDQINKHAMARVSFGSRQTGHADHVERRVNTSVFSSFEPHV